MCKLKRAELKELFAAGLDEIEDAISEAGDPSRAVEDYFEPFQKIKSAISQDDLRAIYGALQLLAKFRSQIMWAESFGVEEILDYIKADKQGVTYQAIEKQFGLTREKTQAVIRALAHQNKLVRDDFPGPIVALENNNHS